MFKIKTAELSGAYNVRQFYHTRSVLSQECLEIHLCSASAGRVTLYISAAKINSLWADTRLD